MNKTNNLLITLNIIFLLYYSIQLLFFTDEFALNNLGAFNHAIAGLSEIIGIIFLSLSISLFLILRNKINGQLFTQKNICLMIGPEGGFSNQEIELAKKHNIKQVTLGKSRLRSETAAIYGLSLIKSIIN